MISNQCIVLIKIVLLFQYFTNITKNKISEQVIFLLKDELNNTCFYPYQTY